VGGGGGVGTGGGGGGVNAGVIWMLKGFRGALRACFRGGLGREIGVPSGLIPTAWRTAGRNVEKDTVSDEEPRECPPGPPPPWKTRSRARRLLKLELVAVEMIGSPIVTQRIATSGRARRIGSARERVRARVRAEGSRLGGST
jgi:hypothetical protein